MYFKQFIAWCKKPLAIINILIMVLMVVLQPQKSYSQSKASSVINMVFTSDAHYGISRATFRGDTNVTGHKVNEAMIGQINTRRRH